MKSSCVYHWNAFRVIFRSCSSRGKERHAGKIWADLLSVIFGWCVSPGRRGASLQHPGSLEIRQGKEINLCLCFLSSPPLHYTTSTVAAPLPTNSYLHPRRCFEARSAPGEISAGNIKWANTITHLKRETSHETNPLLYQAWTKPALKGRARKLERRQGGGGNKPVLETI